MKILIKDREPEGFKTPLPDLYLFETENEKLFTEKELLLISACSKFPSLTLDGPHSGVVADYLAFRWPKKVKNIRYHEDEIRSSNPHKEDDFDYAKCNADCVIETVTFMNGHSDTLYEDLEEYIEYVKDSLNSELLSDGKRKRSSGTDGLLNLNVDDFLRE